MGKHDKVGVMRAEVSPTDYLQSRVKTLEKANLELKTVIADKEREIRELEKQYNEQVAILQRNVKNIRERYDEKVGEREDLSKKLEKAVIIAALREVDVQEKMDVYL